MYVHTCACADMWVLMVVAERSRAEGDSDREVHRRGKGDDWREKSSEKDKLLSSVVDDLRKKGRGEKDIIRRGRGKAREGSWLKEREIPLLKRRSRLSSVSLRNASERK